MDTPRKEEEEQLHIRLVFSDVIEESEQILELTKQVSDYELEVKEKEARLQREREVHQIAMEKEREVHQIAMEKEREVHQVAIEEQREILAGRREIRRYFFIVYGALIVFTAVMYLLQGFALITLSDELLTGLMAATIGEAAALVVLVISFFLRRT